MPRLLLAVALACAGIFCLSQSDVDAACVGSRRVVCLAAPKAAPYMIAGNRLQINQGKAQVALAAEQYFLSRFYVGSANWTAKNCRFLLSNSYSAAGVITNPGNGVNIEKMALWLGGSFVAPITVSGSRSITLADGQYLWTDPVAVSIAPNSQVELRIAGNVTSLNQYLVGGGYRVQTVNAERFATATTTLSGSVDSGTLVAGDGSFGANGFIFNAMACQGWDGTSPVALVLGDSIGWGNLENQNLADARGNYGYVAIGLDSATNGRISMWNTTMFSANMNVVKTNTISGTIGWVRLTSALLPNTPFNIVVDQLGINDIGGSLSAVQTIENTLMANIQTNWPGVRYYNVTLTPYNTSNATYFFTDVSQMGWPSAPFGPDPSTRSQFNAWRLTVPAGVTNVLNVAPSIEDPVTTSAWAAPTVANFPTTLAAPILANNTNIASLNASPPLGSYLVFEPGTGSADGLNGPYGYQVVTVTGTGPYTVTVLKDSSNATNKFQVAHLLGTAVALGGTSDGLHPGGYYHQLLATSLISEKTKIH